MIDAFIEQFTEQKLLHVHKLRKKYYQILPELFTLMEQLDSNLNRQAEYVGVYLGEESRGRFHPSVALLDIVGRASHRWVAIDDKAAWLFVCGRDVFAKSVVKANVKSGIVLVANSQKEVLGYGKIVGRLSDPDEVYIKNFLDKGDFLRREMKKKR